MVSKIFFCRIHKVFACIYELPNPDPASFFCCFRFLSPRELFLLLPFPRSQEAFSAASVSQMLGSFFCYFRFPSHRKLFQLLPGPRKLLLLLPFSRSQEAFSAASVLIHHSTVYQKLSLNKIVLQMI